MKITKEMTIGQIIRGNEDAVRILSGYGLGCVG